MKKVGIHEIARLAKVSIGTVDRALHGRTGISRITRERILKIAQRVGYRPNLAARVLSSGRSLVRIGVCIPREIHFYFDEMREGIITEARRYEHQGVEILYRPTQRLGHREVERVVGLLKAKIHALILAPGNPRRLAPVIGRAEREDIRVICVDTDAAATARSTVVCLDSEVSGRLAAELMGGWLPAGSEVAVLTGMLQTEDHRLKTKGFCEAFPTYCQQGKVLEVIEDHSDPAESSRKCSALLEKHHGLGGLYVTTSNCLPVCRAIETHGRSGDLKLITSDLFQEMIPHFQNGTIAASIGSRPYLQGQMAVRLAVDHLVQRHPLPVQHYVPPVVVMRSILHLFRETRSAVPAPDRNSRASD